MQVEDGRHVMPQQVEQALTAERGEKVVDIAGGDLGIAGLQLRSDAGNGGVGAQVWTVGDAAGQESAFEPGREQQVERGQHDTVPGFEQRDGPQFAGMVWLGDLDERGGLRQIRQPLRPPPPLPHGRGSLCAEHLELLTNPDCPGRGGHGPRSRKLDYPLLRDVSIATLDIQ